jgi:hypothetical protein
MFLYLYTGNSLTDYILTALLNRSSSSQLVGTGTSVSCILWYRTLLFSYVDTHVPFISQGTGTKGIGRYVSLASLCHLRNGLMLY